LLLSHELRQSADLRLVLNQIAEARFIASEEERAADRADLTLLLESSALLAGPTKLSRQVKHLLALTEAGDTRLSNRCRCWRWRTSGGLSSTETLHQQLWERSHALTDRALRLQILVRMAPRLGQIGLSTDPLSMVQARGGQRPRRSAGRGGYAADAGSPGSPFSGKRAAAVQQRVLAGAQSLSPMRRPACAPWGP
jgi:hypothetical protein